MKCVGLFGCVLLIQLFLKLRQREVSLKYDAKKDSKAKSAEINSSLEKQTAVFEDVESDFTGGLDQIPIPEVTVTLNAFGKNLDSSFSSLGSALAYSFKSTSSTLASTSNKLSEMLNNFFKINSSSSIEALSFLSNNLSDLFSSIKETTNNLNIGTDIPGAVSAIGENLIDILQIINAADHSQFSVTQAFDDAAFSVGTKVQALVAGITSVAESAAAKIGTIEEEVKEIVVALTMVLQSVLSINQSTYYSIGIMLSAVSASQSSTINSLLLMTDGALQLITSVVKSTLWTHTVTEKMNFVVGSIGVTLTCMFSKFTALMDKLEARSPLIITDTLESRIVKFSGSSGNLGNSISSSVSTITSSLRIVSASDSLIYSKVSRQLYRVFNSLLKNTGSDDEIITNLSKQLPSISDTIKLVAGSLITGLGTEPTGAVVKAITDILDPLNRILPFFNDTQHLKVKDIEFTTKQIGQNVQILTNIVSAIVSTVLEGIDSVTIIVFECVIALQLLHSTILYVVQWVSALTASLFLTQSLSQNQLASSLAVVVAVLLNPVAKAISMVVAALPDGLFYVVKLTAPLFIEVYKSCCEAFRKISEVVTNAQVTLEQITSGSSALISVKGFVDGSVGTVSHIFNGVSGTLGSISSTLSSSLSSLDSSLKEIPSSYSDVLKTVSTIFVSITTEISNITGTASEIVSLTLNSLNTVFGNLIDVISRLSALGNITGSLSSSLSKIAIALHSIIDVAKDVKAGSVYAVNEPVANVAKSVQILISLFTAIIKAAVDTSDSIFTYISQAISAVPYFISCVVVLVQHILGAVIAAVSSAFGGITSSLQTLTTSMSTILNRVISITTEMSAIVSQDVLKSKILLSVSKLNQVTESSLSLISGMKADMKATFSANNVPSKPEL